MVACFSLTTTPSCQSSIAKRLQKLNFAYPRSWGDPFIDYGRVATGRTIAGKWTRKDSVCCQLYKLLTQTLLAIYSTSWHWAYSTIQFSGHLTLSPILVLTPLYKYTQGPLCVFITVLGTTGPSPYSVTWASDSGAPN